MGKHIKSKRKGRGFKVFVINSDTGMIIDILAFKNRKQARAKMEEINLEDNGKYAYISFYD